MNYEEFNEFARQRGHQIGNNRYEKQSLIDIFNDYIKKQKIDVNNIKSVYMQNFANDKIAAIYSIISDTISVFFHKNIGSDEKPKYLTNIRIIKKCKINEIELQSISNTYTNEIDSYSIIKAEIQVDNSESIILSNLDDSSDVLKARYSEMILHFISQI